MSVVLGGKSDSPKRSGYSSLANQSANHHSYPQIRTTKAVLSQNINQDKSSVAYTISPQHSGREKCRAAA